MSKEYTAYSGCKFTIEWYFNTKGKSQALEFLENLTSKEQQKLFYLLKRMSDFGKISDTTKFNFEGNGIWSFKPQPNRFLSFFTSGKKIIITNAFTKKAKRFPRNEKKLALKYKEEYLLRVEEDKYYE